MAVLELRQTSSVWWEQTLFGDQGDGHIVDNEIWVMVSWIADSFIWNEQRIYDPQGRLQPWR